MCILYSSVRTVLDLITLADFLFLLLSRGFPVRHMAPPPEWRPEGEIMKKAQAGGHVEEGQLGALQWPGRVLDGPR